jgi:hypothetical protein
VNGGPIAYGNQLLETNKQPATIEIVTEGSVRRFECTDDKGRKVLKGSVDTKVSPLDSAVASIELMRQLGPLATVQEFRQRSENAELSGGLVTTSGYEIQAAYKFAPTIGLFRKPKGTFKLMNEGSEFAAILRHMDFEPVAFAYDPHLKTVLTRDDWPTPDDG